MFWGELKQNLLAGLRLSRARAFHVSIEQVAALAVTCLLVIVIFSVPIGASEFFINWTGVTSWAAIGFLLMLFMLAVALLQKSPVLPFATQMLATAPWYLASVLVLARLFPTAGWTIYFLTLVAVVLLLVVAARCFGAIRLSVVALVLVCAIAIPNAGWYRFIRPAVFYVYNPVETNAGNMIDVEGVFREQQALVGKTLQQLSAQRPGHPDIYFVGFAGNGDEPVFRRDLSWVGEWFDSSLDTAGRSVSLSAGRADLSSQLIASPHNLHDILAGIGEQIDPNEDSVFLYLTSHGSSAAYLDVTINSMPLQNLTAQFLRQALDDAGIRWRIIVISACYSGSFIEPLANDQTVIVTAASADKMSFGCGWESDMTWFADAFFRQSLSQGFGLLGAFENARSLIAAREAQEGIAASDPQLFVGDAIRQRLEAIEAAVGLFE